ncbi:hypothetical protein [Melissococcus plutonius]
MKNIKIQNSCLRDIQNSLKRNPEGKIKKFTKNILPYISIILAIISLIFSIRIYQLGEQYKLSLNEINYDIKLSPKSKLASSESDNNYLTSYPYDRYPIVYKKKSGLITERYLFKYNQENNSSEPIKLSVKTKEDKKLTLNSTQNSSAKDLKAFVMKKNHNNKFEPFLDSEEYPPKFWNKYDEILFVLDPALITQTHEYVGIYCLVMIGKNEKFYITTLITKWSKNFKSNDIFYFFSGIDLYDEAKWQDIIDKNKDFNFKPIKDQAIKNYEKSLVFLKNKR